MAWNRIILHVDMDAFYPSVEQLENPALRGLPVIVGGVDSARGVVSSASYEARVFGVRSAMPVAQARRKCPQGIYIAGRHALYQEYSGRLMRLLAEYSPRVETVSVDEAFLDLTGTGRLWGEPRQAALLLQDRIRKDLGLSASVGAAPNKFLAKLASDFKKPAGITVIEPDSVQAFLDPLPVGRLWGVGDKTRAILEGAGLLSISDVRREPLSRLEKTLGPNLARHVHELSHGRDEREVAAPSAEKSISHEHTFEADCSDVSELEGLLLELCDKVGRRARREGLFGRTVSLVWRDPDFSRHSRAKTLENTTQSGGVIHAVAVELLSAVRGLTPAAQGPRRFRLLGVRLSHFTPMDNQLSLLPSAPTVGNLDRVMDAVREKFGDGAIQRGRHID